MISASLNFKDEVFTHRQGPLYMLMRLNEESFCFSIYEKTDELKFRIFHVHESLVIEIRAMKKKFLQWHLHWFPGTLN